MARGGVGAALLWLWLPRVAAAPEYDALVNLTYAHPSTGQLVCEQLAGGGGGRPGSASGPLVHVRGDACAPLDTAALPREPWIALMRQGHCAEALKLRHAAAANASGAVLYHHHRGAQGHALAGTRRHKVSPPAVPLVWVRVGREQGQWLAALADNGTRAVAQVWVGRGARASLYPSINRTSVLFVSVSFILLMLVSLAWLVFYYVQRFRYVHAKDLLARRLCSAAQRALARMPVQRVEREGADGCAVCLEPLRPGELVRRLPCAHGFHQPCVDPWLLEQRSCPMCKMDILRAAAAGGSREEESVLDEEEEGS